MESDKLYKLRLEVLEEALQTFEDSLSIDLSKFSNIEVDVIKNGQVQKFEYCTELLWKTIQAFVNEITGEDINGPKPAIKSFFKNKFISEEEYKVLFEMIDSRNKLAHIYNKSQFEETHKKIFSYLPYMKNVRKIIKTQN